jgi:hypothetical protein
MSLKTMVRGPDPARESLSGHQSYCKKFWCIIFELRKLFRDVSISIVTKFLLMKVTGLFQAIFTAIYMYSAY